MEISAISQLISAVSPFISAVSHLLSAVSHPISAIPHLIPPASHPFQRFFTRYQRYSLTYQRKQERYQRFLNLSINLFLRTKFFIFQTLGNKQKRLLTAKSDKASVSQTAMNQVMYLLLQLIIKINHHIPA